MNEKITKEIFKIFFKFNDNNIVYNTIHNYCDHLYKIREIHNYDIRATDFKIHTVVIYFSSVYTNERKLTIKITKNHYRTKKLKFITNE